MGDIQLTPTVDASSITCSSPSLDGLEITMFVQNADKTLGGYVTLSSSQVSVRIGAGSGATYTQRNFAGAGVSGFDASKGARFDAQLSDTSPAGQNKGAIGTMTSISGSVSCGNETPGSGNITITGNSSGGAISGALTSLLVKCTPARSFALIFGLTHIGATPAQVEFGGGGGEVYFAGFTTSGPGYFFSSSAPGLYTEANNKVHWNDGVLKEGTTSFTITVSGDATCGT